MSNFNKRKTKRLSSWLSRNVKGKRKRLQSNLCFSKRNKSERIERPRGKRSDLIVRR